MKKILRQSISCYGRLPSLQNVRPFSVQTATPTPTRSSGSSSEDKRKMFLSYFPELSQHLSLDPDTPDLHPFLSSHLSSMAEYTIPGGKMNRGLSVPQSFQLLVPQAETADLELANILGWSVEIMQAFYLVADDIMDGSITRRGQPCWYRRSDVGLAAFNDSIILESLVFSIIKKYFRSQPYYLSLLENLLEVSKFTTYGQSLDTLSAENFTRVRGQEDSLESFDMARYTAIVKYKTSYYSFYLPVCLAMNMAGFTEPQLYNQARNILLQIGHYFQATDDFLDCFGDPEVIGKIGTDIQDGKCSWLIVKALEVASAEEKKILARHYGSQDQTDIEIVKNLYMKLGLVEIFRDYENNFYEEIVEQIDRVSTENEIPKKVFHSFLAKVYKRKL